MSFVIIWLDAGQAKLFHFSEDRMEREFLGPPGALADGAAFHDAIAGRLDGAQKLLLLGPGEAKSRFLDRLQERYPRLARSVVACEESDRPNDQQIAGYAVKYFQKPVR